MKRRVAQVSIDRKLARTWVPQVRVFGPGIAMTRVMIEDQSTRHIPVVGHRTVLLITWQVALSLSRDDSQWVVPRSSKFHRGERDSILAGKRKRRLEPPPEKNL